MVQLRAWGYGIGPISIGANLSFANGVLSATGGGGVAWGGVSGTLADQTDLQSALDAKAATGHNHDATYSALGHNHDGSYSALGHNHDAAYSALGHNHDATYQPLSANLTEYAAVNPTAAGLALLDDADNVAQRTTLGLGTLATQNGTFSGTSSGTNTGDQTITLTGNVTGSGTGSFATTIAAGVVTEAMQVLADNITQDVSITKHGYAPKAPNDSTKFLNGVGAWAVPPSGAGGDLALNKHILASDFTVTAAYAAYIPRYLEIAAGVTLEIGAGGDLEIG